MRAVKGTYIYVIYVFYVFMLDETFVPFCYLFIYLFSPTDGLITSSHNKFIQLTNNNKNIRQIDNIWNYIDIVYIIKLDFHCRVIFTWVNKIRDDVCKSKKLNCAPLELFTITQAVHASSLILFTHVKRT